MIDLFTKNSSNEEKYQDLFQMTQENADNHSAYIIQIRDIEAEDGDELLINDEAITKSNAILLEEREETKNKSGKHNILREIANWFNS